MMDVSFAKMWMDEYWRRRRMVAAAHGGEMMMVMPSYYHSTPILNLAAHQRSDGFVPLTLPGGGSTLNPLAPEWKPIIYRVQEELRSIFITFSNGYPLTELQIYRFFTLNYGPCIERIYVHWPKATARVGTPALFGKVVFRAPFFVGQVMQGLKEARFYVEGKPLWCKRFDSTKKKIVWHNERIKFS